MKWFLENWGNLLSAVGLLVTLVTLARAGKAVEAAEAAKRASEATKYAVNQQGAVHALGDMIRIIAELSTLVSVQSFPSASLRSQDLGRSLRYSIERWDSELGASTLDLAEAQSQVDSISKKLRSPAISQKDCPHLLGLLEKISHVVTTAQAIAEKEGNNG